MNEVQKRLRAIHTYSRMSQSALARELGVSIPAFSAWWHGRAEPRRDAQMRIHALYVRVTAKSPLSSSAYAETLDTIALRAKFFPSVVHTIRSRKDILDNLVVQMTYHSDALEGSTLTLKETASVLLDNADLRHRSVQEHMEARNHKAALLHMLTHVSDTQKLTEAFVLRLHTILMSGILEDAGAYRTHGVRIAGTSVVTANHVSVPARMGDLCKRIGRVEGKDPIAHTARIHADFEKIHPFSDGNGRVGRLLLTAMLLSHNYAPAIVEKERKYIYYTYLEAAQTRDDYSFLELFVAEAVRRGYELLE